MRYTKIIYKIIIDVFISFFRVINENTQINILNSISKDNDGKTILFVSPLTSPDSYPIYPHQILVNDCLRNQFRKSDLKIIESLVISEGDIFFVEKEYDHKSIYISLKSIITNEMWNITEDQLINNSQLLNRLNIRFLKKGDMKLCYLPIN